MFITGAFQFCGALALYPEALLGMVASGAGLRGVTLCRSKSRWRSKKKGLRRKFSGFFVQMGLETKRK